MTLYTVVYMPEALAELAALWMLAADRQAVTRAADALEPELRFDADLRGMPVENNLRSITIPPLVAFFIVSADDRTATIWSIRLARGATGSES